MFGIPFHSGRARAVQPAHHHSRLGVVSPLARIHAWMSNRRQRMERGHGPVPGVVSSVHTIREPLQIVRSHEPRGASRAIDARSASLPPRSRIPFPSRPGASQSRGSADFHVLGRPVCWPPEFSASEVDLTPDLRPHPRACVRGDGERRSSWWLIQQFWARVRKGCLQRQRSARVG